MDLQLRILQAIGRLSGPRKAKVNATDLAKAVGDTAASSVVLSNRFFAAVGWIENDGRGLYAATDALVEYVRLLATHDADRAAVALHDPARRTWFWETLAPRLADGPLPLNDATILLMREAEAADNHVPKINNLISWLRLIGLITVRGDQVMLASGADARVAPEHRDDAREESGPRTPGPEVEEPTRRHAGNSAGTTVLAVSFDVRVTADDLARLNPEQIKALFEAVGTVMALGRGSD
jgi:hypothetical protein